MLLTDYQKFWIWIFIVIYVDRNQRKISKLGPYQLLSNMFWVSFLFSNFLSVYHWAPTIYRWITCEMELRQAEALKPDKFNFARITICMNKKYYGVTDKWSFIRAAINVLLRGW